MANIELMDTEDELKFYQDVHVILDEAKSKTYETANNIMTYAYWSVGKRIIEQEQKGNRKAKYGSYLIKRLSQELSDEYGTGFSVANIRNCRQLYLTFPKESRQPDDNPTIGIIFCTDKDETMVKYSVLNESEQIFASKYMTVLPTVEELKNELERNQLMYGEELKDEEVETKQLEKF